MSTYVPEVLVSDDTEVLACGKKASAFLEVRNLEA